MAEMRTILTKFLEAQAMRSLELIREEGREEGEARGRAATLLRQLRLRGFDVDGETRARVLATTDTVMLDRWLDRVISAKSLDDVFAE